MTKYWLLILSVTLLGSCAVSEDMIENKELYCSGLYQGIRAVGRVATEVVSGVTIPDVCDTIDEIVEEERSEEEESAEPALGKSSSEYQRSHQSNVLS
tara:strand:- start:12 stop:305 length:294 start_codon:yes stop_codon:yes gene_type:complete